MIKVTEKYAENRQVEIWHDEGKWILVFLENGVEKHRIDKDGVMREAELIAEDYVNRNYNPQLLFG